MAYDNSLDKAIFSESIEFPSSKITVSVYSYNNGTPKLQISREMGDGGEYKFAKLGRMTKEEVQKVMPIMEKALDHL